MPFQGHGSLLNRNKPEIPLYTLARDPNSYYLYLGDEKLNTEELQVKLLYNSLISFISLKPTAEGKYEEVFNTDLYQLNWNKIFALSSKITLSTKLREFQYKILNNIYTPMKKFSSSRK